MVRSKWKVPFVHYKLLNQLLKNKKRLIIRTRSRSSLILPSFIGMIFEVYTGRLYNKVYIEERMVGHKLGEFAFTRKLGKIHEKKTWKTKAQSK